MRVLLRIALLIGLALPGALAGTALGAEGTAPPAAQDAARVINAEVVRATGLPTRWRGPVMVDDTVGGGLTTWLGFVVLGPEYANERFDTAPSYGRDYLLTHEMLHTVSVGSNSTDYYTWMGWEEGVVEGVRRVIQPGIYRALGYAEKDVSYALGAIGDTSYRAGVMYGTYFWRLERARTVLGMDAALFYGTLIRTPVAKRRHVVRSWAAQRTGLSGADRRFIQRFVSPSSVMTSERYT